MIQNANAAFTNKNPSGAMSPGLVDAAGLTLVANGGKSTALNQTAAAVLKTGAGRVAKVVIIAPGSGSGAFTLNDCATTGAATAANVLFTLPYNATSNVAGSVFTLELPFTNGLTLSAVPGAGAPIVTVSFS